MVAEYFLTVSPLYRSVKTLPQSQYFLIGDGGVGKITFDKHLMTWEVAEKYDVTTQHRVYLLIFYTNRAPITFSVLVANLSTIVPEYRAQFYEGTQCAIIMFEVTRSVTIDNMPRWLSILTCVYENISIYVIGNKVHDIKNREVTHTTFSPETNLMYQEVSTATIQNIDNYFFCLIYKLAVDTQMYFVEPPALQQPEATQPPRDAEL